MINRIGRLKGWIVFLLIVFLAIPLLGWNAFPKHMSDVNFGTNPAMGTRTLQVVLAQGSSAGSIETGQKLFMGNLHFENEGPPCMGCHNIGSNGLLGGGALGPDLTNVTTRRSSSELAAILSNSDAAKAPVMQPIYAEYPLTESEQADLIAFLNASVGEPESNKEIIVIGISLVGFAGAVVVLGFVYRARLRGVRKPLLKNVQL